MRSLDRLRGPHWSAVRQCGRSAWRCSARSTSTFPFTGSAPIPDELREPYTARRVCVYAGVIWLGPLPRAVRRRPEILQRLPQTHRENEPRLGVGLLGVEQPASVLHRPAGVLAEPVDPLDRLPAGLPPDPMLRGLRQGDGLACPRRLCASLLGQHQPDYPLPLHTLKRPALDQRVK